MLMSHNWRMDDGMKHLDSYDGENIAVYSWLKSSTGIWVENYWRTGSQIREHAKI